MYLQRCKIKRHFVMAGKKERWNCCTSTVFGERAAGSQPLRWTCISPTELHQLMVRDKNCSASRGPPFEDNGKKGA